MTSLFSYAMKHPKTIFMALGLLCAVAIAAIPMIQIDTDPENMLPADQPERVYHNKIKQQFALHDAIVVGLVTEQASVFNEKSLTDMVRLVEKIEQIDGVIAPDLMALPRVDDVVNQEQGALSFQWLMSRDSEQKIDPSYIEARAERLPLLNNTLISGDKKAFALYVPIKDKNESYRISTQIEDYLASNPMQDTAYITGLPVAEDTFGYEMFVQMGISAPLAAVFIFVLMWLFFRNLVFVIAPMIVAMATVIIAMGLLIGMGFTVHIMSSMIAIFLMPIAVVDSIHVMSDFADRYQEGTNRLELLKRIIKELYKPMLFTSVTSAVGFLSLLFTPIPPVQIFGAFIAFGILLAFILTLTVVPAYLLSVSEKSLASLQKISLRRNLEKLHNPDECEVDSNLIPLNGQFRYSWKLVTIFVVFLAVSIVGIQKISINDNPVRWFKAEHPIRVADEVLNEHFAGTYDAQLVLTVDMQQIEKDLVSFLADMPAYPALISMVLDINEKANSLASIVEEYQIRIDDVMFDAPELKQMHLESVQEKLEQVNEKLSAFLEPSNVHYLELLQQAMDKTEFIGKSNSLADVVKVVNRELVSGEVTDFAIPNSSQAVAQVLLQYQSSHRPQDLWHFVTKDYSSTALWIQMRSGDNQSMEQVINWTNDYIDSHPLPAGISARWAGKTYLNKVWQDEMVAGMMASLLSAFVVVLLMMMILFRNVWLGLLAMMPLTITISMMYGFIGWIGKDYDMPMAVLSALTLGLSVDFAIHYLERARQMYRENGSIEQTLQMMRQEPQRAISRNAIVIAVGFTPLILAPLMPYVTVGFFLAAIMALSAITTLWLLPVFVAKFGHKIL